MQHIQLWQCPQADPARLKFRFRWGFNRIVSLTTVLSRRPGRGDAASVSGSDTVTGTVIVTVSP